MPLVETWVFTGTRLFILIQVPVAFFVNILNLFKTVRYFCTIIFILLKNSSATGMVYSPIITFFCNHTKLGTKKVTFSSRLLSKILYKFGAISSNYRDQGRPKFRRVGGRGSLSPPHAPLCPTLLSDPLLTEPMSQITYTVY